MNYFLIIKEKTKKIAKKYIFFIFDKMLIILLLIVIKPFIVSADNSEQHYINNHKNLVTNTSSVDRYFKNQILTKTKVIPLVKNRLHKIKNIYSTAIDNNTSLPTEISVSLQVSLLDTLTITNKDVTNIPFIRLEELGQQLTKLIEQKCGSATFVLTTLGYKKKTNSIESNSIIEIQDKSLKLLHNYIPFELEYYNCNTLKKLCINPLIVNDKQISLAKGKINNFLKKYQQIPLEQLQKYNLKINYTTLCPTNNYFNHKKTNIPHSVALYTRMKNNKIDILVFEPLKAKSTDYSGIKLVNVIYKIIQQVIKDKTMNNISFDIYDIPLSVELCGADCMMHAYEFCKEIKNNIAIIDGFCNYMDTNNTRSMVYQHILNNIPVPFFKTIYQIDLLEDIIEADYPQRKNEVAKLKSYLEQYYAKEYFNIFSTSIYEMGIYKDYKNKFIDTFKFFYPESDNTHNYLGSFTNVNTLVIHKQLQLANHAIDCLSDDNIVNKLTPDLLFNLDMATADIDSINITSIDKALAFAKATKNQYPQQANKYFTYRVKYFIDTIITFYNFNIKQRYFSNVKKEISKVQVFAKMKEEEKYSNIGSTHLDFSKYKGQVLAADPEILFTKSLEIINKKINSNSFFFSNVDKIQLITTTQQIKATLDNLLNDMKTNIKHLFFNNKLDIQTADFYIITKYSKSIDLYFFNILEKKVEYLLNLLHKNSNDFFQESLKEKTIQTHQNLINYSAKNQL